MLDGQIVSVIIAEIRRQLLIYGIDTADLRVARSSQPTAQHAGAAPDARKYQVMIEPITNTEIGWRREYREPVGGGYELRVNHVKQKTYQISTLSDFDPSRPGDIVAHDLAQILDDMIKQPDAIRALKYGGVDILSCTPVRPSFRINQSDEYESMPSFDMVVSYNAEYNKPVPVVTDVTGETNRV